MLVRVCDICNKQKDDTKEYFLPFSDELSIQCCGKEIRRICFEEYIPVKKDVCSECAEKLAKFITNMGEADE